MNHNDDRVDIIYIARKNILFILLSGLIGLALLGAYSFWILQPVYEATAKMYVQSQTTSTTSFADIQLSSSLAFDYEEMITSRPVVLEVKENLGLDYSYEEMLQMIETVNPDNTRVIRITCESHDPREATDIANEFAVVSQRQIADFMHTDEPSLFEKAAVPSKPVRPRKGRNMALGFLLGLVAAFTVSVIRYASKNTFRTEHDIERILELNTLAVIPKEKSLKIHNLKFNENGERQNDKR